MKEYDEMCLVKESDPTVYEAGKDCEPQVMENVAGH
jgi:hypothetical protein